MGEDKISYETLLAVSPVGKPPLEALISVRELQSEARPWCSPSSGACKGLFQMHITSILISVT